MAKKRNKNKGTPPVFPQSKSKWTDGFWTKLAFTALGALLVKGADIFENLNRLPDAASQTAHRAYEWWAIDHDWSGQWSNEGCIDCPTPDVFITIDLIVRNGIVGGEVQTPPMIGLLPYPHLMIDGRKVGDEVTGIFYDYVGGQKTKFAEFTMTVAGNDRLIQVMKEPLGIFPKQGDLFRTNPYVEAVEAKPQK